MSTTDHRSADLSRAMDHHRQGRCAEAEQAYRAILERDANQAEAWHLLGFLAFQTRRFQLAEQCLTRAVDLSPGSGEFHHNLALLRLAQYQAEQGLKHAAEARRLGYADASGYLHVGLERYGQGDYATAEAGFRIAIEIEPNSADAYNYQGIAQKGQGRFEAAISSFEQALTIQPHHIPALTNLGNAWRDHGEVAKAVSFYQRAIHLDSRFAPAHNNLGVAHALAGELDLAISCYECACQLDPTFSEAHNNLGNAHREKGDYELARQHYERALDLNATSAEIRNNLGVTLCYLGDFNAAIEAYHQALAENPLCTSTLANLASALVEQGDLTQAAQRYDQIAAACPDQPLWRLRAASLCPTVFPSRESMKDHWIQLNQTIDAISQTSFPMDDDEFSTVASQAPFNVQFHEHNLREFKQSYANIFHARLVDHLSHRLPPVDCRATRRQLPHVGMVVTSRHEKLFIKSLRGILERIDTQLFRVSVFCAHSGVSRLQQSLPTDRIRIVPLPSRFVSAAQALREEQCDLLYYWEVGTDATNYFLPFLRLAPVQCTSWGIQVTTGIPEMDYYISNGLVESEDADAHYSERLVRANTLLCYRQRAVYRDETASRAAWGYGPKDHLYVCAHQAGKLHPDFDEMVAGILRNDPHGFVLALDDHIARHSHVLRCRFASTIPDVAERFVFLPRLEQRDYLRLIASADVLLDPPHFGGVNTTYDSLSLDQPVVTLPSPYHRGRYTLGCYRKMGVTACVAESQQDYVQTAVNLACDRDFRHDVVTQLKEAGPTLFEEIQAVREHERIFLELIERARSQ